MKIFGDCYVGTSSEWLIIRSIAWNANIDVPRNYFSRFQDSSQELYVGFNITYDLHFVHTAGKHFRESLA